MIKKKISMMDIFKNPRYRGKHIILIGGRIYTAKTGEGASKILEKVREKHPRETPEIAYLPKARSLILAENISLQEEDYSKNWEHIAQSTASFF